jgi:hypothetical protein
VFTARYALSPYIKQIRFVFKGLWWKCIDSLFNQETWRRDGGDRGTGVWMGLGARLDIFERIKISCCCWESNPGSSSQKPSHQLCCPSSRNWVMFTNKLNIREILFFCIVSYIDLSVLNYICHLTCSPTAYCMSSGPYVCLKHVIEGLGLFFFFLSWSVS